MKRTNPTPPVGAYPHSRLCDHRGSAPKSAKTKITINTVPSMCCSFFPSFRQGTLKRLSSAGTSDYDDYDANAGMERVVQIVPSINEVHIDVVGVKPADWPRLTESEPIATVLEARLPFDNDRAVNHEHVLMAKIGTKTVVRNAVIVATGALCLLLVLRGRLLLLWLFLLLLGLFLLLLCGLFLLRLFLLLLCLSLFLLSGLLWLRLLLVLLRVFLFLLRVFLLLRVNGNRGSQGQRQNCCADNSY
jgi:hypothetical protein